MAGTVTAAAIKKNRANARTKYARRIMRVGDEAVGTGRGRTEGERRLLGPLGQKEGPAGDVVVAQDGAKHRAEVKDLAAPVGAAVGRG